MAPLPEIQTPTISAIWAAKEVAQKEFDSVGISISELGSDCDRALWFAHRWASRAESLTGQKLRLFETGHSQEARMIADLRLIKGVTVIDADPDRIGRDGKPAQWKVYSHGGHLRGKLDGKVIGLPEAPKTLHVLECKSHNAKNFAELRKKKVKSSHYKHWLQCQKYMQLESLDRCLYIGVNKDTDDLYSERIEYDAATIMQLDARLDRVIASPQAPSRIADSAAKFPCMFCNHKATCHGDTFGRSHCRSCIHATPIVDDSKDAKWFCERHKKPLTIDEQKVGCHAHLYLPDMVPGEQYDSGEDWVAYTLRDGKPFVDQEKKAPDAAPTPEPYPHQIGSPQYDGADAFEARLAAEAPQLRYFWNAATEHLCKADAENLPDFDGYEELTAAEFAEAQAHFAKVAQ